MILVRIYLKLQFHFRLPYPLYSCPLLAPQVIAGMALPPPDPQFVLRGTSAAVHTLHFSCGGQEPDVPILFSG